MGSILVSGFNLKRSKGGSMSTAKNDMIKFNPDVFESLFLAYLSPYQKRKFNKLFQVVNQDLNQLDVSKITTSEYAQQAFHQWVEVTNDFKNN